MTAKKQVKKKSGKIERKALPKAKVIALKKVNKSAKNKTKAAVKKTNTPVKQKAKAVIKKISTPVKNKTKVKAVKKVSIPAKQKAKVVVQKAIVPAKQAAKTKLPEVKAKIVSERPVVPPTNVHGEDLHFIPEHDGITHPVTPLEAHKMENMFHHKEEVALHQENQKVRNAMSSRKTMKVFNRNRGGK